MFIAILGRQPDLSMAELERRFGSDAVAWFSDISATIQTDAIDVQTLGGSLKVGKAVLEVPGSDWKRVTQAILQHYTKAWSGRDGKVTIGISAYGSKATARDVQRIGILLKQSLKKNNVSLRLIPNTEPALNTATAHHNKLGLSDNKVELLIVRGSSGKTIIAESSGTQNITALARRDQGRPKRDAFVGMLPPKLAVLMLNLAAGELKPGDGGRVLDPFCGTGVVLQEAALRGYDVYGTDLSDKMIDYTTENLDWLKRTHHADVSVLSEQGDATKASWQPPIDLVVSETYLGQPFSAPPSPAKLEDVRGNVNHITTTFLKNIHPQLKSGTPLCLAVPAWRDATGRLTHLPFIRSLEELGYRQVPFRSVKPSELIYYREDQVVARQLLVLTRA